jgi:hypothetical protein
MRARNWQIFSGIRGVVIIILYVQILAALIRGESGTGS